MKHTIIDNKVFFTKGAKPHTVHMAQRESLDLYWYLYKAKAARSTYEAIATIVDKKLGSLAKTAIESTPYLYSMIESTAKAYTGLGPDILFDERFKLYSLNLRVSKENLIHYKLSEDLLTTLRALPHEEFYLMTKEMPAVAVRPPLVGRPWEDGASWREKIKK